MRVLGQLVGGRERRAPRTHPETGNAAAEQLHLVEAAQPVEEQRLRIEREIARQPRGVAPAQQDEKAAARHEQTEEDLHHLLAHGAGQLCCLDRA